MYKIYQFKCKLCQTEQEQMVSNTKGKAEDPCKQCGAEAKELKNVIANPANGTGKNVTWGKWAI